MSQRSDDSIRRKQRFFDSHAEGWDSGDRVNDTLIKQLVKDLGLEPCETVVEPGCGTGRISSLLLEAVGPSGKLHALDISLGMLEKARGRGLGDNAEFHHADAGRVPLPAGTADSVVCFRVFPHIDDRGAALAEFNRLLRKDGRLIIAHPAGREKLNRYHAEVGGEVATDMIPEEAGMRELLAEYGFSVREIVDREERYLVRAVRSGEPASPRLPLIAGFCGSPRVNGSTATLIRQVFKGFGSATPSRSEFFDLHRQQIFPCQACRGCQKSGECHVQDGMQPIYGVLKRAHAVVLGSPVYMDNLSAQLKLMIDRLYPFFLLNRNRLPLPRIPAVLVLSQGYPEPERYSWLLEHTAETLSEYFGLEPLRTVVHCEDPDQPLAVNNPKAMEQALKAGRLAAGNAEDF